MDYGERAPLTNVMISIAMVVVVVLCFIKLSTINRKYGKYLTRGFSSEVLVLNHRGPCTESRHMRPRFSTTEDENSQGC